VPANVEGGPAFKGATYTKHPVASGPFMIQSYTQNKQITFVRNPNWSQSTDNIRHPLVDKVILTFDSNSNDIDQKLKAGTADADAAETVQSTFQSQILTDPNLKKNADDPITAFTRYVAVMPSVIPNIHCRLAIFYAMDKQGGTRAYGGSTAGDIATSMTPPGIQGYDPSYNPYPSGPNGSPNVDQAKKELQQCGKPNGFTTKFAYSTATPQGAAFFKAEQPALAQVGIKITPAPANSTTYYSTWIGSPKNIKNQGLGIALAGWGADFPTPYGFYQSIANGADILPNGNSNYPSLNDPTVNKILDNGPSGKNTNADWLNLTKAIMKAAVYVPIYWGRDLYYRNPRMTNVTCNNAQAFGIYDFVNIGVGG
jgi:peptide/nickel transport system substrate-binding protein